jgi:Tol biopolymer transport system component
VAGTLGPASGKPSTVLFTPAAPLDPGTVYVLSVTQGITDLTGDPLDGPVDVSFTTVSAGGPFDGSAMVAFVSNRDGSDAIYVTNSDGSGITRLASGIQPAWSHDGQRIAFVGGGSGNVPYGIYVMNADGSGARFLARGSYPSWSPDGSKIVFNGNGVPDDGIFVMNVDGSGIQKLIGYDFALPDDGYGAGWVGLAAWSPDGHSIAFVRGNYGIPWAIYIMNVDGTAPRLLDMPYTIGDTRFTWSPDGSRLLIPAGTSTPGIWSITSVDATGADARTHTLGKPYVGGPDWSPNADNILFERFTGLGDALSPIGSRMRIFVLNLDDGRERQLIPEAIHPALSNYWDHQAAWSRSGQWDY